MLKISVANETLLNKVRQNNNNCLCTADETKCMCDEFLKSKESGECHCGVYKKELMEG